MLPFDNRPWAKPLARVAIVTSILAAIVATWYLYSIGEFHIPECTCIVLLLLVIVPPNVAILRKKDEPETPAPLHPHARHP